MAFAIGSPPASQQRSRAPTPADELLRMRLQAVEAVEFRGTALLGAEPSPRCSSGAATPGLKASQGRHRPLAQSGLSTFRLRPDLLEQLENYADPARGVTTEAPFACISVRALQDLSRRPRGAPYKLGRAAPTQEILSTINDGPGKKRHSVMRGWAWRPDGWEAPPDNYVEPPPQRVASPMSPQEHVDALRRSSSIYQSKPREDLNPFVPCCSLNCPHEATLWSPLEKKPYCVRCWNGGLHHTDIGAKLAVRREDEEEEAEPVEEEAPPSPQPRLYKGRCFLSDGSFAFRDGPCRLRQRGKALLDVSVISLTSSQRKKASKVREYGDLGTVPLRVVNAKANLEDSRRDGREGSYASGYSRSVEVPVQDEVAGQKIIRSGVITKKIETIGGTAVVVNPNQPRFVGAPDPSVGSYTLSSHS
jgi:hypothetical protein